MADKIVLYGASGNSYTYWIYSMYGTYFQHAAGNYVFARLLANGKYYLIYIGESEDLGARLRDESHHARSCIRSNRATHILAHLNDRGLTSRLEEERDLVRLYNPVCNAQSAP